IPKDPAWALAWYEKAAELGDAVGALLLAEGYWMGNGFLAEDYVLALDWYRKAAELGSIDAISRLGFIYSRDTAGPPDYVQAYFWLSLAAAGGRDGALQRRKRITPLMTPIQIAQAEALLGAWKPKTAK